MNQEYESCETRFRPGDKLATNIDSLIAWLAEEMGYSRDKTRGYQEKLVRLGRAPTEDLSVFSFLGGYWHRFRQADRALAELASQNAADRSLQALAKVVAGLCDKVALAGWCQQQAAGRPDGAEPLALVHDEVKRQPDRYSPGQLDQFVGSAGFDGNPMGRAILELHRSLADQPENFSQLRQVAVGGASAGLLMLRHYGEGLAAAGLSAAMPQPGLGSGDIRPWQEPTNGK